jgi:hypothetical protein
MGISIVEQPILWPYCGDRNIEAVPDARLYAENVPNQTTPISASVFGCGHWHIFAMFPLDDASRNTQRVPRK